MKLVKHELALVELEYDKARDLLARGLDIAARVYAAERERARLQGERAAIGADIARARTRISELESRILDLDESARTEAQRELADVETRHSELQDRRTAIEDRLARTEIRAPIAGTVNELNVHTVGGVITPAEVLATIVRAGHHRPRAGAPAGGGDAAAGAYRAGGAGAARAAALYQLQPAHHARTRRPRAACGPCHHARSGNGRAPLPRDD